jgi:ATP-dependent exoDNAse (exonuclease V) beta subunit
MNINHISISREGVYHTCPQKYKYQYHLQQISTEPTPIYFTFGKLLHRIIEEYTKSEGSKDIHLIKKSILSGELELEPGKKCPELDVSYLHKLTIHLANFMKLSDKIGFGGEVEYPFYIDLDVPNKRMLKGFIDRVILKDGNAFILDYKTTKASYWRKNPSTITKDLQLQCYCWVIMNHFKIAPKNIKAALYYLEDGLLVPACFGENTLSKVPERLVKVYKEIENANPDHVVGNVGNHCKFCDWRSKCPFYSLT